MDKQKIITESLEYLNKFKNILDLKNKLRMRYLAITSKSPSNEDIKIAMKLMKKITDNKTNEIKKIPEYLIKVLDKADNIWSLRLLKMFRLWNKIADYVEKMEKRGVITNAKEKKDLQNIMFSMFANEDLKDVSYDNFMVELFHSLSKHNNNRYGIIFNFLKSNIEDEYSSLSIPVEAIISYAQEIGDKVISYDIEKKEFQLKVRGATLDGQFLSTMPAIRLDEKIVLDMFKESIVEGRLKDFINTLTPYATQKLFELITKDNVLDLDNVLSQKDIKRDFIAQVVSDKELKMKLPLEGKYFSEDSAKMIKLAAKDPKAFLKAAEDFQAEMNDKCEAFEEKVKYLLDNENEIRQGKKDVYWRERIPKTGSSGLKISKVNLQKEMSSTALDILYDYNTAGLPNSIKNIAETIYKKDKNTLDLFDRGLLKLFSVAKINSQRLIMASAKLDPIPNKEKPIIDKLNKVERVTIEDRDGKSKDEISL